MEQESGIVYYKTVRQVSYPSEYSETSVSFTSQMLIIALLNKGFIFTWFGDRLLLVV